MVDAANIEDDVVFDTGLVKLMQNLSFTSSDLNCSYISGWRVGFALDCKAILVGLGEHLAEAACSPSVVTSATAPILVSSVCLLSVNVTDRCYRSSAPLNSQIPRIGTVPSRSFTALDVVTNPRSELVG